MNKRISEICRIYGHLEVISGVRDHLDRSWAEYAKSGHRTLLVQDAYVDTLACLDRAVRMVKLIPVKE